MVLLKAITGEEVGGFDPWR